MRINLKRPEPGTWFQFPDDEARICLRLLTGFRVRQIERETEKTGYTYKDGKRFEDVEIDHDERQARVWDETILEWSGINDESGKPLACNRENKSLLMRESVVFYRFYLDSMVALGKTALAEEEEERKNS